MVKEIFKNWIESLISKPVMGRPAKLSKTQRMELSEVIKQGPEAAGFPGACWRTPMIKYLIEKKFNVTYSTKYLKGKMITFLMGEVFFALNCEKVS